MWNPRDGGSNPWPAGYRASALISATLVSSSVTRGHTADLPELLSTEAIKKKCLAHSKSLIKVTPSHYSGGSCHLRSQLDMRGTVLSAGHV